ncbi:MAG TPA: hypothetical protein VF306_14725 [Pirellulales bacterium]
MSERVTVGLSAELAAKARAVAAATKRSFEEVVVEWVGRGAMEPALEHASDDELLALCDASLPLEVQQEPSDLLTRNRESQLGTTQRHRLDELMASYRHGLVQKARAWQVAVARGINPPLSDPVA